VEARRITVRWRRGLAVSRRMIALLVVALLTAFAIGCGGGDDDASSGDVPSGSVATVGDTEISEEDLDDQVVVLARAQRSSGGSPASGSDDSDGDEPSDAERKQLEAQALSMLLLREALEQEAADRDIEVSDEEVEERWDTASQGQFKTEKALKRFLGGQTEEDLLAQLRLQVITERIHEQVSEQAGGGKKGAKAVKQFQKEFQKRWQNRTACAKGYAAAGCS
jgi:hypothetical protein